MSDYIVETSDGVGLILVAKDDMEACVIAQAELAARRLQATGLNLFRYPACWTERRSAGLIWVPLFRFLTARPSFRA
jgi:hypothetical protein